MCLYIFVCWGGRGAISQGVGVSEFAHDHGKGLLTVLYASQKKKKKKQLHGLRAQAGPINSTLEGMSNAQFTVNTWCIGRLLLRGNITCN